MRTGVRARVTKTSRTFGIAKGEEGTVVGYDVEGGVKLQMDFSNGDPYRAYWFRADEYEFMDTPETKSQPTVTAKKADGGGGQNHYDLPKGATQLQDLIEYRNMNGSVKDVFKACYRLGEKEGVSDEYDLRKMVFYSLRELGRQLGRKDYITLAKEVIAHQAIEEVDNGPEEEHY